MEKNKINKEKNKINTLNNTKKTHKELLHSQPKTWYIPQVIVVASSTGGPVALENIITKLDKRFNKPILIVQHMPPEFTKILAKSMNKKSILNVSEAQAGDVINDGNILISPGGIHMTVHQRIHFNDEKIIRLKDTPPIHGVRPSADVLFKSVAKAYEGKKVLAIVLTGMGNDGRDGIAELKEKCDCYCITQSAETCVVYGMPRSVYDAGLSDEVLDLDNIAERMQEIVLGRSGTKNE